jgi:hypothetical protein
LELAIRTHPSYATAHENLGDIYAKMASQAYDKALQLDKGNATAQTKLGMIKELFSRGGQGTKVSVVKPEIAVKSAPPSAAASKPSVASTTTTLAQAPSSAPAPSAPAPTAGAPPKTSPEPAAAKAADATADVLKAVNNWAKAWSDNDVNGYLASYAKDFQPPGGATRAAWESTRKARIAKPREIEVQVDSPKVKFTDPNHAVVTFRQNYRSGSLKAASTKTLVMVKSGERWVIQQERVGS